MVPEVVIETHAHAVQRRREPFLLHPSHHVLCRFSEPDSARKGVDSGSLSDEVRNVMLFLIFRPDLFCPRCICLTPDRDVH